MKKTVLAKISKSDAEKIRDLESIADTYRSLLTNQFISEDDYNEIEKLRYEYQIKLETEYKSIFERYKIPHVLNHKYHISEDNTIYVETN